MLRVRQTVCLLAVLAALAAMGGCFERHEKITISQKGSISFELTYRSDSIDDLINGDVMPSPQAGWATEQKSEKDKDGKETFTLTALALFPPNLALPANFAPRNDGDADLYLQFPTTLKIEKRRDGAYYHFHRVYTARPWVQVENLRKQIVEEPLKGFEEPSKWTDEQRVTVVKALANFETEKALVFARGAFLDAAPNAAQDGWLAVRDDLRAFVASQDYPTIAKLLEPRDERKKTDAKDGADEMDKTITAEAKRFEAALNERFRAAFVQLAGLDGSQVNAVMEQYRRRTKAFEVTEDLGDEKFEINLEMPGPIVASNADEVNGRIATWKFDGDRMRDVDFELMATARVSK